MDFKIVYDIIDSDYFNIILNNIDISEIKNNRSVFRWGKDHYKSDLISSEYPKFIFDLIEIIRPNLKRYPESVTLNYYRPGDNIPPHIDVKECGDVISILSLLSDVDLYFSKGRERKFIRLPKNSLFSLEGELRWEWKHFLYPVKYNRISIVFR